MNEKRRELLSHNRRIKRKMGAYVLRLQEHEIGLLKVKARADKLEMNIRAMAQVLAMEELRIKEDIDKLIGILNGCYDEEGI
ncbi:hypothetical protein LCGC14_0996970 [marine sediment metagenome]|uniref:Uncharacterized protein n=1 Tax=marine sediment metagenome TaxID=412755 RepID=A0A0F9RAC2_9ZZZZ